MFTALLGTGRDLLPVWETLDQAGLVDDLVPAWERVRCAPQYSSVHRHTVDRHLLETCVQAARLVRQVHRPDLLLVAALLHDIGKGGSQGDGPAEAAGALNGSANGSAPAPGRTDGSAVGHSEVGADLVHRLAPRWGFEPADVATLVRLVRHHLLLIETATRRDLDDPATIRQVAAAVGDAETLDLLTALTEADARATGSAAWTPWRAGLLARLVGRVHRQLERGQVPAPTPLAGWQRELVRRGTLDVVVEPAAGGSDGAHVTVVAPDRVGLLATVAGVLALARVSVRSATVETLNGVGLSTWSVVGDLPDAKTLRERLAAGLAGGSDLRARLGRLDASYQRPVGATSARRSGAAGVRPGETAPPDVRLVPGASATATVVEVRAHDRPGLFHQVCTAVASAGCSVRSAHVSTWAGEAVDVFYLTGPEGGPLADAAAARVRQSLEATLAPPAGDGGS